MPMIKVRVRHDCWTAAPDGEDRQYMLGYAEDIDADDLSPRARALAEAVSTCGRGPLNIAMETSAVYVPPPISDQQAAIYGSMLPPHLRDTGEPARKAVQLTRMRADSSRATVEYLETLAHELSRDTASGNADWYPLGTCGGGGLPSLSAGVIPAPSAEAARADVYLTRDETLARMRGAGRPMAIGGWDTLRGTGHLPAPDRYVAGRIPQWLPAGIDDYLSRQVETWTLTQVAAHLGFGGTSATAAGSARKQLSRWGITAVGRAPGRGGESLYDADQVRVAAEQRPGRGARTDLKPQTSGDHATNL